METMKMLRLAQEVMSQPQAIAELTLDVKAFDRLMGEYRPDSSDMWAMAVSECYDRIKGNPIIARMFEEVKA